jgi:N-glycosylase/DNA lyase
MALSPWHGLPVAPAELDLRSTLRAGQAFRWVEDSAEGHFTGVLGDHVLRLRQQGNELQYRYCPPDVAASTIAAALVDYFRLDASLADLYRRWADGGSLAHVEFRAAAAHIRGLRILRQPPAECLFSFICSQNNNIKRISGMIERLAGAYGAPIAKVDGVRHHAFPTVLALAKAKEARMRSLGFGYRAAYIVAAAKEVARRDAAGGGAGGWLESLQAGGNEDDSASGGTTGVVASLMQLPGVGRKVADCVALFSLDYLSLVPVDTHVWQMAQRYMGDSLPPGATLTTKRYGEINAFFRAAFGPHCGWAHCVLFAAAIHRAEISPPAAPPAKRKRPTAKRKSITALPPATNAAGPKRAKRA